MINKLYSLLISCLRVGAPSAVSYLYFDTTIRPAKDDYIVNEILRTVRDDNAHVFCAWLCSYVASSAFADELRRLDPINTYDIKLDTAPLFGSASADTDMKKTLAMVDDDLTEKMVDGSYTECLAACCIHVLRRYSDE